MHFVELMAVDDILIPEPAVGIPPDGQHIDVALMDVLTACLANQGTNYLFSGVSPTRMGNTHPNVAPYDALPCSDGYLILAVGNDRQFARACAAMDLDELAIDRRYSTNAQRIANRGNLTEILANVCAAPWPRRWARCARLLLILRVPQEPCADHLGHAHQAQGGVAGDVPPGRRAVLADQHHRGAICRSAGNCAATGADGAPGAYKPPTAGWAGGADNWQAVPAGLFEPHAVAAPTRRHDQDHRQPAAAVAHAHFQIPARPAARAAQ